MPEFQTVKLTSVEPQLSGSGVVLVGRTLFNRQDYNPDLQGQQGTRVYERMRRDPKIAGLLHRWKAPLLSANWAFEAPKKVKNAKAQLELCDRYILGTGRDRVQDTFKAGLLPQILLMLDFGVSAIEKVWGVNEKGQQVYARLAPIGPQSIYEFEIGDLGQVLWLVQYAYTPKGWRRQLVPDPKVGGTAEEKIAVFTFRQEGDDFFGRSVLRELYQPWFHKSELWALDGMQKERCGMGLTIIKIPGSILDTTSDKYQAAQKVAFELRAHERQGAVIGEDWELEQIFPTGTPPDILGSQKYCDEQMALAMAAEFDQLGLGPNGTRSLSESKTDQFMLYQQALADNIEEMVNTQLVKVLIDRNLGPQEEYVRLQCEDLDKMTGGQQAEMVKVLHDAGMIRYDRKLEEHFRENGDLPEIDDATREEPAPPAAFPDPFSNPFDRTRGNGNKPDPKAPPNRLPAAEKAHGSDPAQTPRFWRGPMAHELHVQFEEMADFLDTEPLRIWHRVVKPFRDQQIAEISKAAAKATVKQLSRGIYGPDDKRPREARMAQELTNALLAVYLKGRGTVLEDRQRQIGKAPAILKADIDEEDDDEAEIYSVKPSQRSWIRTIANGFALGTTLSLLSEAVKAGLGAHQQDLPEAEVEATVRRALTELSEPRVAADLAGEVVSAFTTGRSDQGFEMRDQLSSVFYSAMMDSGTCMPCRFLDGAELDADTYSSRVPNPNCDGGIQRCRCEPVFVFRPIEEGVAA